MNDAAALAVLALVNVVGMGVIAGIPIWIWQAYRERLNVWERVFAVAGYAGIVVMISEVAKDHWPPL